MNKTETKKTFENFAWGNNGSGQLGIKETKTHSSPQPIIEIDKISKLRAEDNRTFIITKKKILVAMYLNESKALHEIGLPFERELLYKLSSGANHSHVITRDGRVYTIKKADELLNQNQNQSKEVKEKGLSYKSKYPRSSLHLVLQDYFVKKGLKVKQIVGGLNFSIFLCTDGSAHVQGMVWNSALQANTRNNELMKFGSNVTRLCCGSDTDHFFYLSEEQGSKIKFYGVGKNSDGQLGLDNTTDQNNPKEIKSWVGKAHKIKTAKSGYGFSVMLTVEGEIYSCGATATSGHSTSVKVFTQLKKGFFNDEKVIEISSGGFRTLALTEPQNVYGWGSGMSHTTPFKINFPNFQPTKKLRVHCGCFNCFVYSTYEDFVDVDFQKFWKIKEFNNHTIGEFPVNKQLIEWRFGKPLNEISQIFENQNFETSLIERILKWAYSFSTHDKAVFKFLFDAFGLNHEQTKDGSFQRQLSKLHSHEDSKDFLLLIKDEEDEEQDEDEEQETFEEIPVHKFILLARSGLFREMFNTVKEEKNSVTDYSGKSIDSLEIFVKYLYTNKIELTADHDPELIYEELKDAIEYYQLNPNSDLLQQLNSLKNN
ncbi:btk-binding protein-related [Anaeramoeba flamelloides]|uniref:Btk-binding protein-related n=1 Tax=Anaeramoeba flamelloides TaxID=1746091 RepID=A0ABQ8ZDE2_9EUKA|nr:btk-binding protein-related [Anaeramoeba flamelloides]